jgi:hypothetical protein
MLNAVLVARTKTVHLELPDVGKILRTPNHVYVGRYCRIEWRLRHIEVMDEDSCNVAANRLKNEIADFLIPPAALILS